MRGILIKFTVDATSYSGITDNSNAELLKLRGGGISVEISKQENFYSYKDEKLVVWQGEYGCKPDFGKSALYKIDSFDKENFEPRGLLLIIDFRQQALIIKNDLFGTFPLFYYQPREGGIIVSSLLNRIPHETEDPLDEDPLGIYQFLCGAYTVGSRTLVSAIHRLPPASVLKFDFSIDSARPEVKRYKNVWKSSDEIRLTDDVIEQLSEAFHQESKALNRCLLMFSAGWDSRLILAGLSSAGSMSSAHAYTHGELGSREVAIAKEMAQELQVRHTLTQLDGSETEHDIVDSALKVNEDAMFLHWSLAAKLNQGAIEAVTGGIFGGFIGGHYGIPSVLPGSTAKKQLIKYLLGVRPYQPTTEEECLSLSASFLAPRAPEEFWCFSPRFNERIKDEKVKLNFSNDISNTLSRYFNEGTIDPDRLTERYLVEHRGSQYMNSQLRAVLPYCQYRNPYTNVRVSEIAGALDPRDKVHNKVHQHLVKKLDKRLLKYPMAATLVDASKPIWFQELSRGLRKMAERNKQISAVRERFGRYPNRSLGWNNFEHLRNRQFLDTMCSDLTNPMWDADRIKETVMKRTDVSMYSFFDMVCKIRTIDYRIKGL